MELDRRRFVAACGASAMGAVSPPAARADEGACPAPAEALRLSDFRPKSMLHATETRVATPRYPVIDVHTHFTFARGGRSGDASDDSVAFNTTAAEAIALLDRKEVRSVVNLTGGFGRGLEQAIATLDRAHPGRFHTCTEPMWAAFGDPRYPQLQADAIERGAKAGARGLKVLKTLGLFLRERGREGPLVTVDDRRFDPMWEACAAHRLPVYIHVSDPEAFFLPIDCTNERCDELGHHPDWSFHGKDYPSHRQLMEARDRVLARHPKTLFVGLHVGHNAENLGLRLGVARPLPQLHGRARRADRRAGTPAARGAALLRGAPGPHLLRHRRGPAPGWREVPAAGLQGRALRDLLPLPRDRGRVLRLRAGAGAAAGALAHLRHRAARRRS